MENLLGDDPANPTPPAPATPPADDKPNELEELRTDVNTLGEGLQKVTGMLEEIAEKLPSEPAAPAAPATTDEEPPYSGPEGQPKDWKEVREKAKEDAEKATEAKLAEKEEEAKSFREAEAKTRKAMNDDFDQQVVELEKEGLITPVKDQDNADDQGRSERRELFGLSAKIGTSRLKEVAPILKALHDTGQAFDLKTGKVIRTKSSGYGKQVPVGSSTHGGGSSKGSIDYKTLHESSIDSLIEMSKNA
jgi:hypothetical protein